MIYYYQNYVVRYSFSISSIHIRYSTRIFHSRQYSRCTLGTFSVPKNYAQLESRYRTLGSPRLSLWLSAYSLDDIWLYSYNYSLMVENQLAYYTKTNKTTYPATEQAFPVIESFYFGYTYLATTDNICKWCHDKKWIVLLLRST